MEDTELKLEALIRRAINADESAFDGLVTNFRNYVYIFVRRRLKQHEDAEDILQNTFLSAHQAIRNGNYQHHNLTAFRSWLRMIAWREIIYHTNHNLDAAESLFILDQDGTEVLIDRPNQSASAEEAIEYHYLHEFLDRQLDEALILSQPRVRNKDIGLLKKQAFVLFYIDCFSQKQIVTIVSEHAARLNVAATINQTTINNWTSRGDILRLLMRHLVEKHHDLLRKLTCTESVWVALSEQEKDILQRSWKDGDSEQAIAALTGLPPSEIEKSLRAARRKVADALVLMIKRELHNLRHDRRR